ncbi:hypothetical protein C7M84_003826, partial [Penaeus vannamei]
GYTLLQRLPGTMTARPGRRRAALAEAEGRCCVSRRRASLVVAWTEMILLSSFFVTLLYDFQNADGRLLKTLALMVSCLVHLVLACLLLHALRESFLTPTSQEITGT